MLSKLDKFLTKKSGTFSVLLLVIITILFLQLDDSKSNTQYIVLSKDGFYPKEIKIDVGTTVVFTTTTGKPFWPASDMHPTHGIYPEFDPQRPLEPDESWSFKFEKEGLWRFHDHLNSRYDGSIVVTGNKVIKNNCSDSSGKIICWQSLLNETLEKKGLPQTFDLLSDLYAKEPLFASECHSFVHEIGKSAYEKFSNKKDFALNSKTSYCGYGFYHGFMEELLSTTGDIKKAQEFCKYVGIKLGKETSDGEGACYHGIGHGAVDGEQPHLWGDPQKMIKVGLDMCEKVAGEDRSLFGKLYRCVSGSYNSIEILAMDPKYKLSAIANNPFSFCPSQKIEFHEACYTNMLPAILRLTENDLKESQKYIEKIDEKGGIPVKSYVTSSLFHEFVRLNLDKEDYNKLVGINICHSLKESYRIPCIDGLSGGHMKYGDPGNGYIKGLAFCASSELKGDEKSVCYNHILSRLEIWYSKDKSREICQNVPKEYQNYCLN